jgi:prepilin-type N-terminal cleavage/methylation domain-containing protein
MTTHRATRSSRGQAGFTFVELLMAMIVLGLLAAVMIPNVLGQRSKAEDASAASLLRTGASALEAASVDADGYATLNAARLSVGEPGLSWLDSAGAQAPQNQISVTGVGPQGYTLSTTTSAGHVYVLAKDLTSTPTTTRTCGTGCDW